MAVQEQTPLQEYTANGITKQFDLEFDCESADHLIVSIDDLEVLHTDWYLSGNAIMFHVAPANGKQVKIQRNTPFNRLADYQSYNNSFRPPAINKDFDRIWWKLQELGVADWILSNRISALKTYVDDRDDELRAYLMEEIRKQGVALDQLDEYYNYLMQRLAEIAVNGGWEASFVVDASGKTQQEINSYLFKNTYYAEREGILVSNSDNSSAWESLHSRLNHGDVVIFGSGTYRFSRPMEINKVIRVQGKNLSYTQFNFYNQTHGVVRKIRGGELRDIFIRGTQSGAVFNFNSIDPNNVNIGNIGLYDKYNEVDSFGSYNTTVNVTIQYFDVGRANITEGTALWNGAYRESYNLRINHNRCGLVFLNGTTDEKYYGGLISANSEIGIWAYDDNSMYNNIKFIGTTIEGNGIYDSNIGYSDASPSKCNMYVGGNSSVYLIGSYNEQCYNIVENGGQLYKIGSHQHVNAVDATKGGYVYYSGINWGDYYRVPYYNRLSSFIYGFSGATVAPIAGSKGVRITSNVDQSSTGYAVRSRLINLPSGIASDNIKGFKFRLKYKINSGFTQNSGLRLVVAPYLYAKDGSYTAIRQGMWSRYQLTSGNGAATEISVAAPIRTATTPVNWDLNKGTELSHIYLEFSWRKEGGTNPNFAIDNLDMEIYDIEMGLFARDGLNLTEYKNTSGTTATRPILTVDDKGYEYFDTTLQKPFLWNGGNWVEELTSDYLTPSVSTTTLQAASNAINTTGKRMGKLVYNSTTGKMYFALGTTPTSAWRATDNSGDITPV